MIPSYSEKSTLINVETGEINVTETPLTEQEALARFRAGALASKVAFLLAADEAEKTAAIQLWLDNATSSLQIQWDHGTSTRRASQVAADWISEGVFTENALDAVFVRAKEIDEELVS